MPTIEQIISRYVTAMAKEIEAVAKGDARREVAKVLGFAPGGGEVKAVGSKAGRAVAAKRAGKAKGVKRPMGCIAPGCKNKSKGPRFRYLCEKHLKTPLEQVKAWQKARA